MKITIDTEKRRLAYDPNGQAKEIDLYSKDAFELISDLWIKLGWNQKYTYTFSWMGRPVIQLPEDLVRIQEVIYSTRPDVIIETGIAHGGSLIFYASLFKAMNKGRVIGIDIEIRPHNLKAIKEHELIGLITLIEGSSIDPEIVARVKSMIKPGEKVLVILDSNHTNEHVRKELEAYCGLVNSGSYIVATDGIMQKLFDVPRGKSDWKSDNPQTAALDFLKNHSEFVLEQPVWPFNESELSQNITHWPGAWLKKN